MNKRTRENSSKSTSTKGSFIPIGIDSFSMTTHSQFPGKGGSSGIFLGNLMTSITFWCPWNVKTCWLVGHSTTNKNKGTGKT